MLSHQPPFPFPLSSLDKVHVRENQKTLRRQWKSHHNILFGVDVPQNFFKRLHLGSHHYRPGLFVGAPNKNKKQGLAIETKSSFPFIPFMALGRMLPLASEASGSHSHIKKLASKIGHVAQFVGHQCGGLHLLYSVAPTMFMFKGEDSFRLDENWVKISFQFQEQPLAIYERLAHFIEKLDEDKRTKILMLQKTSTGKTLKFLIKTHAISLKFFWVLFHLKIFHFIGKHGNSSLKTTEFSY